MGNGDLSYGKYYLQKLRMNQGVIASNIAETKEQLDVILGCLLAGEMSEDDLRVYLLHAYHHLNMTWNGRNMDDDAFYDGNFHELRRFPPEFISQFEEEARDDV